MENLVLEHTHSEAIDFTGFRSSLAVNDIVDMGALNMRMMAECSSTEQLIAMYDYLEHNVLRPAYRSFTVFETTQGVDAVDISSDSDCVSNAMRRRINDLHRECPTGFGISLNCVYNEGKRRTQRSIKACLRKKLRIKNFKDYYEWIESPCKDKRRHKEKYPDSYCTVEEQRNRILSYAKLDKTYMGYIVDYDMIIDIYVIYNTAERFHLSCDISIYKYCLHEQLDKVANWLVCLLNQVCVISNDFKGSVYIGRNLQESNDAYDWVIGHKRIEHQDDGVDMKHVESVGWYNILPCAATEQLDNKSDSVIESFANGCVSVGLRNSISSYRMSDIYELGLFMYPVMDDMRMPKNLPYCTLESLDEVFYNEADKSITSKPTGRHFIYDGWYITFKFPDQIPIYEDDIKIVDNRLFLARAISNESKLYVEAFLRNNKEVPFYGKRPDPSITAEFVDELMSTGFANGYVLI